MFDFAFHPYQHVPEATLSEQMSAITNKLKFVVCTRYPYEYDGGVLSGPETLLATYRSWDSTPTDEKMLPEILKKRWQTLDVKSMMSELQRSSLRFMVEKDTLSSVHRFKRKEGTSLLS